MEPIHTVMIIILVIWTGIFGYMWTLDRRIKKLKEKVERMNQPGNNPSENKL